MVALHEPRKKTFGWQVLTSAAQPPLGHLYGALNGHGGHVSSDGGHTPPNGRSCTLVVQASPIARSRHTGREGSRVVSGERQREKNHRNIKSKPQPERGRRGTPTTETKREGHFFSSRVDAAAARALLLTLQRGYVVRLRGRSERAGAREEDGRAAAESLRSRGEPPASHRREEHLTLLSSVSSRLGWSMKRTRSAWILEICCMGLA